MKNLNYYIVEKLKQGDASILFKYFPIEEHEDLWKKIKWGYAYDTNESEEPDRDDPNYSTNISDVTLKVIIKLSEKDNLIFTSYCHYEEWYGGESSDPDSIEASYNDDDLSDVISEIDNDDELYNSIVEDLFDFDNNYEELDNFVDNFSKKYKPVKKFKNIKELMSYFKI